MNTLFPWLLVFWTACTIAGDNSSEAKLAGRKSFTWDDRGYLIFCLCMGRFGNQVAHLLGGLAFAKAVDRTLIIPPWRTYKNVPFNEWFKLDPLLEYHRAILAEDFMEYLAPDHWPPEERVGVCFSYQADKPCVIKQGNPFKPFWDELDIDFNSTITTDVSYRDIDAWKSRFPSEKYPVVALKGAPAPFPMREQDRPLQKYLPWSDEIKEKGDQYIKEIMKGKKFIGIHLRNGPDWDKACQFEEGRPVFMESEQCFSSTSGQLVTRHICFPPLEEVLRLLKEVLMETRATIIYVATDKTPYMEEITEYLKEFEVSVFHQDPYLPQIDLYILGQSELFIGNCVSSFTAVVARERAVAGKPTSFFSFS